MVVMMHFLSIQFPHFLLPILLKDAFLFFYILKSFADLFLVITLHLSIYRGCCTYKCRPFWNNWLRIKLRAKFKLKILVDRALF